MVLGATAAEMTAAEETVAAATEVVEMAEAETKSEGCPPSSGCDVSILSFGETAFLGPSAGTYLDTCGSSGI